MKLSYSKVPKPLRFLLSVLGKVLVLATAPVWYPLALVALLVLGSLIAISEAWDEA